jgi:hypothetical protein
MVGFVNYKKGCTRLTATSDKVYQLLVHDRWFSSVTPASSTTKTGNVKRHKKPIELVVREQVTAISWLEQVVFL